MIFFVVMQKSVAHEKMLGGKALQGYRTVGDGQTRKENRCGAREGLRYVVRGIGTGDRRADLLAQCFGGRSFSVRWGAKLGGRRCA